MGFHRATTAAVVCLLGACAFSPSVETTDGPLPRADEPTTTVPTVPATVVEAVPDVSSTIAAPASTVVTTPSTVVETTTTLTPIPLGGSGTTEPPTTTTAPAATTSTTSAPTTTTTTEPPVTATSDSFGGTTLGTHWSVRRPDAVALRVRNGSLEIDVQTPAPWSDNDAGFLLHQSVGGDIAITAALRVRRLSDTDAAPDRLHHLAGIMLRDPASEAADENSVFVVVGHDDDGLSIVGSSTVAGASSIEGPTWPTGDAHLRLCRTGATITMQHRAIGDDTWVTTASVDRPDLADDLQAGVAAYTAGEPDLRVFVDNITYERASAADCP